MDNVKNMPLRRCLNAKGTGPKKAIATGIFLMTLLIPEYAGADCTRLIDKHLEYFKGIKDHLANSPNFDPGVKKIPYDVKIIDNNAQQYPLLTRNVSFFYPSTADDSVDFGFQGAEASGYIPAMCEIQTPDGLKWIVWKDDIRFYFFDEEEQPH